MNGYDLLIAGLYHVRGRFGALRPFMQALSFDPSNLPYDLEALSSQIYQFNSKVKQFTRIDGSNVLEYLISQDLNSVQRILTDPSVVTSILKRKNLEECIEEAFMKARSILEKNGVKLPKRVQTYIVEKFPNPYSNRDYSVMVADKGDEESYGISPGIYYLRESLRPFYSEYLACHEIIHVVLGDRSPDLLAHGLEEGIAEVLGAFVIARAILGKRLAEQLFIYNRLGETVHPLWEQYLDFTRAAAILYRRYGDQGLFMIVNKGREAVKSIEESILNREDVKINLGNHNPPDEDIEDLDFILNVFPRSSVVSPMAFHVAAFVQPGLTVREIATLARTNIQDTRQALEELASDFSLVGTRQDGTVVTWSDTAMYLNSNTLRYRVD